MADRPYIFFELTNSLCSTCLRKVEAKVIFQEGRVYLVKHCPLHKQEKVLISTDADYYQFSRRASSREPCRGSSTRRSSAGVRMTAGFVPTTNSTVAWPWWRSPTIAT